VVRVVLERDVPAGRDRRADLADRFGIRPALGTVVVALALEGGCLAGYWRAVHPR
jgi:hypothetical protein